LLTGTTVTDDGEADVLVGGPGRDWFWVWATDLLRDRTPDERAQP
jgi:hypothetical protein